MMDQLRITSIRPGRNGSDPQSPNYANYDEYITARPSRDNVASTTGK
jgi:hypothetical protein